MGIYLYSQSGADSYGETGDPDPNQTFSGNGDNEADIFIYNVNVSAGESVVIAGDFGGDVSATGGSGFSLSGGAPSFGSLEVNTDGTFTYSFDRADVDANGGNQTISFQVNGIDDFANPDTDTVNVVITCFGRGTLIATPKGETTVETLNIGDMVRTAGGRDVPVKWIGRQSLMPATMGPRSEPVLIRAGALGGNCPHNDLTVTADHGMILDGMVVNAGALVGADGIDWVPARELPPVFTVYHVETADHDVILANGAPAETFCDVVGRAVFDNHQEYIDIYGAERILPEMAKPRISSRRLLPDTLRTRLEIAETQLDFGLGAVA